MRNFKIFAKRFTGNDEGATAIEYGLLAALIAVAIIGGMRAVSGQLQNTFSSVANEMANTEPGGGN